MNGLIAAALKAGKEALEVALEHWQTTAIALAIALAAWGGKAYSDNEHAGLREKLVGQYNARIAQLDKDLAKAKADGLEAVLKREREHAREMDEIGQNHQKEIDDAIKNRDRVIADLRAGSIRVRDRLTCAAQGGGGTSASGQAGTAPGFGNGSPQAGLSGSDVELLLRIASEADEVTRQLGQCQAVIRRDRGEEAPAEAEAPSAF